MILTERELRAVVQVYGLPDAEELGRMLRPRTDAPGFLVRMLAVALLEARVELELLRREQRVPGYNGERSRCLAVAREVRDVGRIVGSGGDDGAA